MEEMVKVVVAVPESHADNLRESLGKSGAGRVGNYEFCSFTCKGTGRFLPIQVANPSIGEIGKLEEVAEEQVQTFCYKKDLSKIVRAIKETHPYEEPVIEVWPLLNIEEE